MPLPPSIQTDLDSFCEFVRPQAEALDKDTRALDNVYREFCRLGLHTAGLGEFQIPGGSREWFETLTQLSAASGSVAWLAIQQYAMNPYLAQLHADPWPALGGAYGQLRTGKVGIAPTWNHGKVSGRVPWFSGAGIFSIAVLGFFLCDGSEAYAAVDATSRPEFTFGETVPLAGCAATSNVAIEIRDLVIPENQFLQVNPPGTRAAQDEVGVLNMVPLTLGVCKRALEIIEESPRVASDEMGRCARGFEALTEAIIVESASPANMVRRHQLRSEAVQMAMNLARIATMASLPSGLRSDSPANRLYREALFFACVGGQTQVLSQAVDRAFPRPQAAIRLDTARLTA